MNTNSYIFIFIAGWLILMSSYVYAQQNDCNSYVELGINAIGNEELDKALKYFSQAINHDSNCSKAYYERAELYNKLKKYDVSILDFTKAIELEPLNTRYLISRGVIYGRIGDLTSELTDYNKAVEIDNTCAFAYYNLGVYNMDAEHDDLAINYFYKVDEIYTKKLNSNEDNRYLSYLANYKLGIIFSSKKIYDLAYTMFKYAKSLYMTSDVCNQTGNVLLDLGYYYKEKIDREAAIEYWKKALSNFDKAIELDNKFAEAYRNRGYVNYLLLNDYNALKDFEEAVRLNPSYGESLSDLMHKLKKE